MFCLYLTLHLSLQLPVDLLRTKLLGLELCWILRPKRLGLTGLYQSVTKCFENYCHCLDLTLRFRAALLRTGLKFRWILILKKLATVVLLFKLASLR